jgi:hypothetical protein
MRRAINIFGTAYSCLAGIAFIAVGFFHRELAVYGVVIDDTTSVKLVIIGVGAIALAFYIAERVRQSNV